MDELRPTDPSWIGGHRLLGRLGAGGMGVVYLGRTDAGALAAIKVILPEYAGDDEFRTRFRREVAAARSVRSPWAVSVTAADTEGERPWLATAFVPGPALSDVVAHHGPLPARSVRVLGRLLARALSAVHAAGLVHRDVKPGNVLLTADGPRLIDFGIARAVDATALTAADLVVGTPGFLSPEQATGRGTAAGPASDVFSLGCLLAYAATGRPPFGGGPVGALLYRTVHDEPDLDAVGDSELRSLFGALLSKAPEDRPTAARLDELIVEDVPNGSVEWLPDDIVRLIADRSAAVLALPGIDATTAEDSAAAAAAAAAPGTGTGTGARPESAPSTPHGRRRFLTLAAGGAVGLAGGAFAVWEIVRDAPSNRDSGKSGERPWIIGVQADLSGARSAAGRAQERGVRLAVERFNSLRNKPFTLDVKAVDDRGDAARAVRVAESFTRDPRVLAVIGPTGDAETSAVLTSYDEAMLPVVSVSSMQLAYAARSKKSFFQASPTDAALAEPIINRLLLRPDVFRLGVLLDRSGGQSAYQVGYVTNMQAGVLTTGTAYPRVIPAGTRDLGPVIDDMTTHSVDSFFYAGDSAGAARTARALAAVGFEGPRMAMHTAMVPRFLKDARDAANGWEFTAPFTGATAATATTATATTATATTATATTATATTATAATGADTKDFAAAHRKRFGAPPAYWAAEAYDAAGLVVAAVSALAVGTKPPTRAALVARIAASTYKGISRTYAFDENHRLVGRDAYLHEVVNGRFRFIGPAPKTGT